MKLPLLPLLLAVLTCPSLHLHAASADTSPDAFEVNRRLGRGVNILGYDPMAFTHQGAPWTGEKDKSGIAWGTDAEQEAVRKDFGRVSAWARENRRPILLGEFGAYDKAPEAYRIRYTDFVTRAAEAEGWSWSYWQFDSDFILWDMKRDAFFEPILKALIPAGKR